MGARKSDDRGWTRLTFYVGLAAVSCVPLYFVLTIAGGLLSQAEQSYGASHRTPVRYELPKGFLGKGAISFNDPAGPDLAREGSTLVFRVPPSGRLRLRASYDATSGSIDESVVQNGRRLPRRRANGDDEERGAVVPKGVGFYWIMNDDANPANGYDDANRQAFFVGTHEAFVRLVKAGKIKPWK